MASKTPRLLEAAKEFNLGKETLLSFLTEKGFEVSPSPSFKLTEEMYNALRVEFAQSKHVKQQSQEIKLHKNSSLPDYRNTKAIDEAKKNVPTNISNLPNINENTTRLVERDGKGKINFTEPNLESGNRKRTEINHVNIFVRERINMVIKNKLSNIDLSNMELTSIPTEIADCYFLREIDLQNNHLEIIDNLKNLDLEVIYLNNNRLKNIDFSAGFKNLKELAINNNNIIYINLDACEKLEILDIESNLITDIQPLSKLKNLRELNAARNLFDNIQPILSLKNITKLNLNSNKIDNLSGIGNLTQLVQLNLGRNKIIEAKYISNLYNIRILDISDNNIFNIEFLIGLKNVKKLYLGNNLISNIDNLSFLFRKKQNEIEINLSNNPIKQLKISNDEYENHYGVLYEYFRRIKNNVDKQTAIHFAQLLVLGNGEVGKTSVLRTITTVHQEKEELPVENNSMPIFPDISTHGNVHYYWDMKISKNNQRDTTVTLLIKDFGGQEYYHHFHPVFYNADALYWLIVTPYKSSDANPENGTFPSSYWINNIIHSLSVYHQHKDEELKFEVWLIQNKIDKIKERIPISGLELPNKYFDLVSLNPREFDLLDETAQNKYKSARELLYYELIDYLEQSTINEKYYSFSLEIFKKLREVYASVKDVEIWYSKNDFKKYLYDELKFPKETIELNFETILSDLRHLGICLYFPANENLKEYVYLYPERLSEIIFRKILPIETIVQKRGILDSDSLREPNALKKLLEHFEIIFQDGEKNIWIVPQYLPSKSQDEDLIHIASDGLTRELKIVFDGFMPQGIMSRLISFFGQNPHKKWYWRNGIFFTHELNHQKIKVLVTANWETEFSIRILANDIKELEFVFVKVLLSYYNRQLNLNDNSEKNQIGYLRWLDIVQKDKQINISLSLNQGPKIPLQDFKKWIPLKKATFDFLVIDPKTQSPSSYMIKIHYYIPFVKYLIDTKEFEALYQPKKIFISYSHTDSDVLSKLVSHFKLLEKAGLISTWYDMIIDLGNLWNDEIENKLKDADIVILLISDNFFASEYIWNKELPIIEEKIQNQSGIVIPIICRHCLWSIREPFASRLPDPDSFRFKINSLQGLPIKNSKLTPIHSDSFKYIDEAYAQIAEKLQLLIQNGVHI